MHNNSFMDFKWPSFTNIVRNYHMEGEFYNPLMQVSLSFISFIWAELKHTGDVLLMEMRDRLKWALPKSSLMINQTSHDKSHFCIAQECGRSRHQHESSFWVSSVEVKRTANRVHWRHTLLWRCHFIRVHPSPLTHLVLHSNPFRDELYFTKAECVYSPTLSEVWAIRELVWGRELFSTQSKLTFLLKLQKMKNVQ